jgi:hypothetical protein
MTNKTAIVIPWSAGKPRPNLPKIKPINFLARSTAKVAISGVK